MKQMVLATSNSGKLHEYQQLLAPFDLELKSQAELSIDAVAETGNTFLENALLKAKHASRASQLPALADDSGLVVPALEGAPGIFSARYAGIGATAAENNSKLLQQMQGLQREERQAFFFCAIALVRSADDASPVVCQSTWYGSILEQPQGTQGFGYDPLFYVPAENCSAAELSMDVKNRISHRALALQELVKVLTHDNELLHCATN